VRGPVACLWAIGVGSSAIGCGTSLVDRCHPVRLPRATRGYDDCRMSEVTSGLTGDE